MTLGEQAYLDTIRVQRDAALNQWADANGRMADMKASYDASVEKLKARIAELEAVATPDDHA